ncbi:MAG: hypothetical protein P1U88_23250 [Thalassobaculaceae bacterium]|nr:hypothetical protein [Thalassobaculaceae bacterium]
MTIDWFDMMQAKQDPVVAAVLDAFPGSYICAITPKETPAMDFTPNSVAASSFAEAFDDHVSHVVADGKNEERARYFADNEDARRPSIGAGRLGNECKRALGYEYHRVPVDEGREPNGKLHRIFDRGHDAEERMAEYLRAAGFTLLTHRADGKQFRFDVVAYEDGKGRIKGMADGVVTAGPEYIGRTKMAYPCLWENKELGNKSFNKIKKDGVQKGKSEYYVQCQLNMLYLGLHESPGLFTMKSADTQEIYAELIAFDPAAAQEASDRGVQVVKAASPEELPRIARDSTGFQCKICDHKKRCWSAAEAPAPARAPTNWLGKANS